MKVEHLIFGCWVSVLVFCVGAVLISSVSFAYTAIGGQEPAVFIRQCVLLGLLCVSLFEGIRATY